MTLTPDNSDELCKSCDGRTSQGSILYVDRDGAINNVSTTYVHHTNESFNITFDMSYASDVFNYIYKTDILNFKASVAEIINLQMQIADIIHVQFDASSCWSNIYVRVNFVTNQRSVAFIGTPLDCQITDPIVYFQFYHNNQWNSLLMYGMPGDGEYDSSSAFVFKQVSKYTVNVEKALIDPARQEMATLLLNLLSEDKGLEMRLLLETMTNGIAQQTYGDCTGKIRSYSQKCLAANVQDLQPMTYFQEGQAIFVGNISALAYMPDCQPYNGVTPTSFRTQMAYQLTFKNGSKSEFYNTAKQLYDIKKLFTVNTFIQPRVETFDIHDVVSARYNFFFFQSADDFQTICFAEQYAGDIIISKIEKFKVIVTKNQICNIFQLYNKTEAYKETFSQYLTSNYTVLATTSGVMQFNSSSYDKYCYKSTGKLTTLKKALRNNLAVSTYKTTTEYIISHDISLEDEGKTLQMSTLFASITLVVVIVATVILIKVRTS